MNISEFWKERKEERKQQKLLKKQSKKTRTKQQKLQRFFGICLALFIIVGATYTSCSSNGGSSPKWNDYLGISDEIVAELNAPVDTNLILSEGKLTSDDIDSLNTLLLSNNIDIFTDKKLDINKLNSIYKLSISIDLNNNQIGALIKEIVDNSTVELLHLKIYELENNLYIKSVAYVQLKNIINDENFPGIYLVTNSQIKSIAGNLTPLNSDVKINNLSSESNKIVIDKIDELSQGYLTGYINKSICDSFKLIQKAFDSKIVFKNNGVTFNPN